MMKNAENTNDLLARSFQPISTVDDLKKPNNIVASLLEKSGNERTRDIIVKRYGLLTGERLTLEEIGESYGLTRERIRQIQAKALKRMKLLAVSSIKILSDLAEDTLYQNYGILTAEEADKKIPEIVETKDDGSSVLDLLNALGEIQKCVVGDIQIYSPRLNKVDLCKLSEKVVAVIKKDNLGLGVDSIVKRINLLREITDPRFNQRDFVFKYCKIDPRIEEIKLISAKPEVIFRYYTPGHFEKKGWIGLIDKVLEQEQMPLHFTEITNRVNDLIADSGKQLDVRRAHFILIENENFAHSGIHGTYGLTSWGLRKETTTELIEECLKKAGFPLHWKQIYNYVSKFKDSRVASIVSVLENNRKFKRTSSGVYWFRG